MSIFKKDDFNNDEDFNFMEALQEEKELEKIDKEIAEEEYRKLPVTRSEMKELFENLFEDFDEIPLTNYIASLPEPDMIEPHKYRQGSFTMIKRRT